MKDLRQRVCLWRQRSDALPERVDEQDHQRPPEPVMDRAGDPVGVTRRRRRIECRSPDPCGGHRSRRDTEPHPVTRRHVTVSVLAATPDGKRYRKGRAEEYEKKKECEERSELLSLHCPTLCHATK